jgi:nucleotide-binding universal stress UspA family protein
MRALIWITESSWARCVDRARQLLPADAEITILHVASTEAEALAEHPAPGRLGRHRPPPPGPDLRRLSAEEASGLLQEAARRLGRPATTVARRGHAEREVLEAAEGADLLVLARDGEPRREPKSVGREARFVIDHVGCEVLVVWPQSPPGLESMRWPPHLRGAPPSR